MPLLKHTSSLCPTCLAQVPAEVIDRDGVVYLQKSCAAHGVFEAVIASDAKHYHLSLGRGESEVAPSDASSPCCSGGACCGPISWDRGRPALAAKPVVESGNTRGRDALDPRNSLLLHDPATVEHSSTCIALIEIVTSCNLECPTCFAGSEKKETVECLPYGEAIGRIESVLARKKNIDILQLSGGEPTIHPDFFRILEWVLSHPRIGYCLLNTNGVRLAQEPEFGAKLGQMRRDLKKMEVYLQFDGPQEAGQVHMRGLDLRRLRERALAVCAREEIPATLAMTVDGHNLAHLGDTLRLALAHKGVRGITFQPMFGSGRAYDGVNLTVEGKATGIPGTEGVSPSPQEPSLNRAIHEGETPPIPGMQNTNTPYPFQNTEELLDKTHNALNTIERYQGNHLPHWELMGSTYAITFHLADSLPADVLKKWTHERETLMEKARKTDDGLTDKEKSRIEYLFSQKVQNWLDAGHGTCVLKNPKIAQIVRDSLLHFHGHRYDLLTWCIMPNHVHVVVRPYEGNEMGQIVGAWKSFAAKAINQVLGKTGPFWMEDYFDRLIRNRRHLRNAVFYTLENPVTAKLAHWPWVGMLQDLEKTWADALSAQGLATLLKSGETLSSRDRGRLALASENTVESDHTRGRDALDPRKTGATSSVQRPPVERLSVADIVREVVAQSGGLIAEDDFTPLPCGDPNCHTVGYLLRHGEGLIGLSHVVNLPELQGFLKDRINFSLADLEKCGCESEELGHILRALEIGPHSVLRLFIKPFMDAWTYDQHRIDRCCVHVVGEGGKLESFCRHYAMR